MRILIYVEPHPIRNTLTHFDEVARGFLPLLKSSGDVEIRMLANHPTLSRIEANITPEISPNLLIATPEEERIFRNYLGAWDHAAMAQWQQLMEGSGEVTESYLKLLHRIWREFPFDVVVHWGDNGAVRRFADEFEITRVAMELGCTRPPFYDSVTMDPFGANGSSFISKLSMGELKKIVGPEPLTAFEALRGFSSGLSGDAYRQQFEPLPFEISSRLPEEKLVFFPLQLFDDANLLRYSPYETVKDVVLDTVPTLADSGYTVIIKPHPAAKHRNGASLANLFGRHVMARFSNSLIWLDESQSISNARLFSISEFVVTVNSSVGFEALYFDKPVVVLGDASYKPKGLFPTIDEIINSKFDYKEYKKNVGILRKFLLLSYLLPAGITGDLSEFIRNIYTINGLTKESRGDHFSFAKGYWQAAAPTRLAKARSSISRGGTRAQFSVPARAEVSQQAYRTIVNRLITHSGSNNLESFDHWLETMWHSDDDRMGVLEAGGIVDRQFYLETYPDVREAGCDPVDHFNRYGMDERRLPRANARDASSQDILSCLKSTAEQLLSESKLPLFPLETEVARAREGQIAFIRKTLSRRENRIAVVAHLYYEHLVPQIMTSLEKISEAFDLIVSVPTWGNRGILATVKEKYPDALFYEADNRGRDIGPFVDILPILAEKNYDAVLKLHTKLGYFRAGQLVPSLGEHWRNETFQSLTGSANRVRSIIAAFRENESLNMVGSEPYLVPLSLYPYGDNGRLAQQLLQDSPPADEVFFAGTMFWFRPRALHNLTGLSFENFSPEDGAADGALAHIVERMLGHAAGYGSGGLWCAPVDPAGDLIREAVPSKISLDGHLSSL